MITPNPFASFSRLGPPILAGLVFAVSVTFAQEKKPESGNDRLENKDEPLKLNPFVVTTSGDVGYLAQNSISGSRLNTKLSELATPVTAFTKEFLDDIASTSIADLAQYMPNTEYAYPEGATATSLNAGANQEDNPPIRIRGLPAVTPSINFFSTKLRIDNYQTERIEQSRGPNSILFGFGSPGGVVNVTTKRATPDRAFTSLTLMGRTNDGYDSDGLRTVIDINQPLVAKRLGLRVAAVQDNKNTWRHEWDDQRRIFATLNWVIGKRTELNAEWEHGLVNKEYVRTYTADDAYTPWANAGKQLSNTANAAAGIRNLSTVTYLALTTNTGITMDWRGRTTSNLRTVDGLQAALTDFSILPKDANIYGMTYPQLTNYSRGSFFLRHSFTREFQVELAGNISKVQNNIRVSGGNLLLVDTNPTLPTGQPNPNAGRPYVEGFPVRINQLNRDSSLRLSAVYEKDIGRILGRHQIAVLGEMNRSSVNKRQQHQLLEPLSGQAPIVASNPENGNNILRYRTYLDLNGPVADMGAIAPENFNVDEFTDAVSGRKWSFSRWFDYTPGGSALNHFAMTSTMGVIQSRFWGGRLITVAGVRKDWQKARYSLVGVRGPANFPGFALGEYLVVEGTEKIPTDAINKTLSAVFRVKPWLSVTYNHASNSALPDPTAILPTEQVRPPNPEGQSDDIGIKVDLTPKLYVNALYFETSAANDFSRTAASTLPHIYFNPIWNALGAAGVVAPDGIPAADHTVLVNGYTFTSAGHGYEFELVANPTENLRIFLNYSRSSLQQSNLGPEQKAYIAQWHDFWLQGNNGRVLLDGSGQLAPVADDGDAVTETVAEQIKVMDQALFNSLVLPEGQRPRSNIPYKLNLVMNYSFLTGRLKGFSIGTATSYRSGEVVGYDLTTREPRFGKSTTMVNGMLGYKGRAKWIGRDVRWSVQLNVNNLLDETDILPMRTSTAGEIIGYRLQSPREWIFTSRFSF